MRIAAWNKLIFYSVEVVALKFTEPGDLLNATTNRISTFSSFTMLKIKLSEIIVSRSLLKVNDEQQRRK